MTPGRNAAAECSLLVFVSMARAIYKATIVVGEFRVPVRLYSAVEDRAVHFRLLHASDGVPVQQRLVHSVTGEAVDAADVRKGYPVEKNVFVLLDQGELSDLEPESSRDIRLWCFTPRGRVDPQWYERPYYLGPDGDDEAYFALASAMEARGVEAIVTFTMRKKRYAAALVVRGDYLALITLRSAEEVVSVPALSPPERLRPDPKEQRLAEQLVAALEAPFDAGVFHDEYRERVSALVAAKASGESIEPKRRARPKQAGSLTDVLRRSITAAKEKRVA